MARHAIGVLPLLLLASTLLSAAHASEMKPRGDLAGSGRSNNQFIYNHDTVTPAAVITPRPNDPEPVTQIPEPVTSASDPVTTPNPASAPQDVFTDDPFGTSGPSHSNAGPAFDPNDPLGGRDPLAGDDSKTGVQTDTTDSSAYAGTVQPNQVNQGIPITPNTPNNDTTPNFPNTPNNDTTPNFPDTPDNVTDTVVAQNSTCDKSDLDGYTSSYQITKHGHVLHWAVVSSTVVKIAFEAKHRSGAARGWVSVGFSKDGKMSPADAIIGNLPDSPIAAYSVTGYDAASITVNKDLWIGDDASLLIKTNGSLIVKFQRNTTDGVAPISTTAPVTVIWAFSADNTQPLAFHGDKRRYVRSPFSKSTFIVLLPRSLLAHLAFHGDKRWYVLEFLLQIYPLSRSFHPTRTPSRFSIAHLGFLFVCFRSRSGSFQVNFSCNGAGDVAAQQTMPSPVPVPADGANVTEGSLCTQSTLSEFDHQVDLYDGKYAILSQPVMLFILYHHARLSVLSS
ncbi:unnamed protein product [Closterium sp. NIES-54]